MDTARDDHAVLGGDGSGGNSDGDRDERRLPLLNDQPIRTERDDKLRLDGVASALQVLIVDAASPPFTIAVNGRWGTGKTSLARLLEARLTRPLGYARPHLVCWFDAWSHSDAPDVTAALAAAVARDAYRGQRLIWRILSPLPVGLRDPRRRRWWVRGLVLAAAAVVAVVIATAVMWAGDQPVKDNALQLGGIALAAATVVKVLVDGFSPFWAALSGYVKDAEKAAATGAVSQVRDSLAKLARRATRRRGQTDRRLVVVVDDLDRCPPSVALDICTATSQLLPLPNVVVVLLADMEAITAAAGEQFESASGDNDQTMGRRYLEKIVQFQIDLPAPTSEMLMAIATPDRLEGRSPAPKVTNTVPEDHTNATTVPEDHTNATPSDKYWKGLYLRAQVFPSPWGLILLVCHVAGLVAAAFIVFGPWLDNIYIWSASFLVSVGVVFGSLLWLVVGARRRGSKFLEQIRAEIRRLLAIKAREPFDIAERVYADLPDKVQVLWPRPYIEHEAASAIAAQLVEGILGPPHDTATPDGSPYIQIAADLGPVLPVNPRQRKRVANQIVLSYLVADRRDMLRSGGPVTIPHVAKWAVLRAQWPEIHQEVLARPAALEEYESIARADNGPTSPDGLPADLCGFLRTDPPLHACVESLVYMTAS